MRRILPAVLGLAAVAGIARAEVRLDRFTREVRVVVTESGPWTSRAGTSGLLNPLGDVEGDGAPAIASSDHGCLVAWLSPSRGELRLARGGSDWFPTIGIPAPDAHGTPWIVRVEDGWLVAVRERDDRVGIVGLLENGDASDVQPLGDGRLVSARRAQYGAEFVVQGRDGCLETITVGLLVPDPRPIDTYRSRTCSTPGEPVREPRPRPPCDGTERFGRVEH